MPTLVGRAIATRPPDALDLACARLHHRDILRVGEQRLVLDELHPYLDPLDPLV